MTELSDDRTLLDAFRRGVPTALAHVYRQHAPGVFEHLSRGFVAQMGDRQLRFRGYRESWALECAVQEVFARAFSATGRQGYDGLRPYNAYLFGIVRNLVIDAHRRERDDLPLPPSFDEEAGSNTSNAPEAEFDERELAGHCEAFLASLEAPVRNLFEARFRLGLSIEQTAQRLQMSEHQVKRTERQLKKRFFVSMKAHGYFEGFRYGTAGLERAVLGLLIASGGLQ